MNKILVAASLALLVGTSSLVSAQAATAELKPYAMDMKADMRASEMIGQRIYATDMDVEGRSLTQAELAEFDDIGEVNDVILSPAGEVKAVVLGVGGFLGLGEQDVTVEMSSLRFVPQAEGGDSFIVVNATKDQLQAIADEQKATLAAAAGETVEQTGEAVADAAATTGEVVTDTAAATGEAVQETGEAVSETAAATGEAVEQTGEAVAEKVEEGTAAVEQTAENVTTKTVPVETTETASDGTQVTTTETAEATPAPAATTREPFVRPQVQTEGYTDLATTELTADDITGKRLYGASGEDIGEVSDLVMGADGQTVEQAVLDVGGFLGIGERKIAVPLDELQFVRNADGDVRIYIQATQEQLEAQPEYVAE